MPVPLFRTSLLRSTQFLSLRNVSRAGTARNSLKSASSAALPSHSVFVRSRNFTTTLMVKAAAAKSVPAKKKAAKGPTVAKKVVSKKKPGPKKKSVKAKKVPQPRILKKDFTPPFKKPLTSWVRFATEFAKTRPAEMSLKEVLLAASPEWKNMSEEQKAAYATPAGESEEYLRKLVQWKANLPFPMRKARLKYRSKHARAAPLSLIAQFVKEEFRRAQYPPDVTTAPLKLKYLVNMLSTEVSEAEKAALKERAAEEYKKKKLAAST